jgi:hypothetical protein
MYATCLFCNQSLGNNETFETFPVGRRLAFDARKGRLWVVCRRCERWNLTPLEERWEAIERAEGLYRDTRRRVSTNEIGLARLRDGTELVRIGEPLRPEFAAWRYGDQFGRRRRRQMFVAGAGVATVGGLVVGGALAGVTVGAFGGLLVQFGRFAIHGNEESIVARIQTDDGRLLRVRRRHLAESVVSPGADGSLALDLRFIHGQARFEGSEAKRIAAIVVPKVNRYGGARQNVLDAANSIEESGGAEAFLERLSRRGGASTRMIDPRTGGPRKRGVVGKTGLYALNGVQRLAFEMALHEEAERRALDGELDGLERAWREAEEIAAIADDMFLPNSVMGALERFRKR